MRELACQRVADDLFGQSGRVDQGRNIDASVDAELGSEPLYSFEAYALRVFTTLWY